ncbi:MAG: hypothetical protein AAFV25_21785 [Bacteroidota bacterium]
MKSILCTALLATGLLLLGCNKSEENNIGPLSEGDHLIFGTFYGECIGNCTTVFKLTSTQLFADDLDQGLPEDLPFQSDPLEDAKYQSAKMLLDDFPGDLLGSDKRVYGCPDCGDQGGFYFQLKRGEQVDIWRVDTWDEEQSGEIVAYKKAVREVMDGL